MRYEKQLLTGQINGFAQKHGLSVESERWNDRDVYHLKKEYGVNNTAEAVGVQLPDSVDDSTIPVINVYDSNFGGLELAKRMALFYDGEIDYIVRYLEDPTHTKIDTKKLTILFTDI